MPVPVRCLIVYNSALEPHSVSGVLRHFADVVPCWTAAGHEVDFLTSAAAFPLYRQFFPQARLLASDRQFRFDQNLRQTWRCLPAFAWRMVTPHFTKLPVRYDVVLACAQFVYEVGPARTIARRCGAALAVKIHHLVHHQRNPSGIFDRMHFWSERITARWLNRDADLILMSTPLVARHFAELEASLGLKPSVTLPTGYGVDLEQLPRRPENAADYEYDAVLLGRIHQTKGVLDVPALWQAVRQQRPGAKLLIIGEGPHREELQRRLTEVGLGAASGAVTFTGGISDPEKNRLLPRCRIGLSLSREEGWGLSVTEFLAVGLPVVAMEVPVFRDIFPGQLDLVPPGDTNATATRVLHWLNHPDEARSRAAAGQEFVRRYDHREVARREMVALEAAVQRRRSRQP